MRLKKSPESGRLSRFGFSLIGLSPDNGTTQRAKAGKFSVGLFRSPVTTEQETVGVRSVLSVHIFFFCAVDFSQRVEACSTSARSLVAKQAG
jgi:hypothetical protein